MKNSSAKPDAQFRNHIQEVEHAEVLYNVPCLPKNMFASFTRVKPGKQWENLVEVIAMNVEKGKIALDYEACDVDCLAREEMERFFVARNLEECGPGIQEITRPKDSPCAIERFWYASMSSPNTKR
jgi:hypothetical protein